MKAQFKIFFICFILIYCAGLFSCEKKAYQRAEAENSIQAFEQYLKKYPAGKNVNKARNHLDWLYFVEARKQNTIQAYEDYVIRFPNSPYKPTAMKILMALIDAELAGFSNEQISQMRAIIRTDYGEIKIKFYPDSAPLTCRNFIKLARAHFYDNSQFHLVIPGYLIQGGAPFGDPDGGPGYVLRAEFNNLSNVAGAVGMARGAHPDSAGSQFYICIIRIPERDGKYTVFGIVENGLEIAEKISNQENTGPEGKPDPHRPLKPIYIKTIEIVRTN